jgi:hypothetical protein
MAKIGEVSELLAVKFGLSPSLLALFARVLAEGHVREKDRRGPGAGTMGARDIANFLIAILGSRERPKDAVKAVNQIGPLLPPEDKQWQDVFHFLPVPSLSALPEKHTFADALTALLECLASGEFESSASAALQQEADLDSYRPNVWIEVTVSGPHPRPEISISFPLYNDEDVRIGPKEKATIAYGHRPTKVPARGVRFDPPFLAQDPNVDLRFRQTFRNATLIALAELLSGDEARIRGSPP